MRRPTLPIDPSNAEEYERDLEAYEKRQSELGDMDREEKGEREHKKTQTVSEQEIIEGNKLIAESPFGSCVIDNKQKIYKYAHGNGEDLNTFHYAIEGLKYHTSWDWFMPAYRKFKDALIEMHKSMPPNTVNHGDAIEVDIHCAVTEVDLIRANRHLVKGIKWYNQLNQEK